MSCTGISYTYTESDRPKRLVRSFLRLSTIFAFGMPLSILASIVLARNLTAAEFGRYGLSITVASVLAIPVVSGMSPLLMREVAGYAKEKSWEHYHGLINSAYLLTAIYAVLLGLGYMIFIFAIQSIRSDGTLIFSLILVPILGLTAIFVGVLRGFGHPALAAVPVQVLQPVLLIACLVVIAALNGLSTTPALTVYAAATLSALFVLRLLLKRGKPRDFAPRTACYSHQRQWVRSYLPFLSIGAVNILNNHLAVLMLGMYGNDEAVAYLRIAERGALLIAFPLAILETILGPQIVHHVKDRETIALRRLARNSIRLATVAALPIAFVLVAFGAQIISLTFGRQYAGKSYVPMVVLVVSQALFTTMGSAGLFLAMSGHEKHNLIGQIIGIVTLVIFGLTLIPAHGALGAAFSAGVGLLSMKTYFVVISHRKLSIWTGIA